MEAVSTMTTEHCELCGITSFNRMFDHGVWVCSHCVWWIADAPTDIILIVDDNECERVA